MREKLAVVVLALMGLAALGAPNPFRSKTANDCVTQVGTEFKAKTGLTAQIVACSDTAAPMTCSVYFIFVDKDDQYQEAKQFQVPWICR